jgi:FkbM family methyltransferase
MRDARALYRSLRTRVLDAVGWPRSFALNDLDRHLAQRLDGRRGGFFIEAGANDGISQSNTLYFEQYLGWTGLLIEPIPALAEACRRNRPGAIVENAALVPFSHRGDTVDMRYCGLMSVVRDAMRSQAEEDEHMRVGSEIQRLEVYDISVPAKPMQAILDTHGIREADLFVLDVEGFEAAVLSGIDFDRFVARNLVIEARYLDQVEATLAGRYRMIEKLSHHDYLFRPIAQPAVARSSAATKSPS